MTNPANSEDARRGGMSPRLNTLENSRKSLARILRLYAQGKIEDAAYFRNLVYGLSHLLNYWKVEHDLEFEKRLEEIEAKLERLR